jgi:hypothetical protein
MTSTAVMMETCIGTDCRRRSLRLPRRSRRRFMPGVSTQSEGRCRYQAQFHSCGLRT